MTIESRDAFKPQELASLSWAFAKASVCETALFEAIVAENAIRSVDRLSPQHLSNLAWAFATVRVEHTELMKEVALETVVKAAGFELQGLSNVVWAFATLGIHNQTLFRAITLERPGPHARPRVPSWVSQAAQRREFDGGRAGLDEVTRRLLDPDHRRGRHRRDCAGGHPDAWQKSGEHDGGPPPIGARRRGGTKAAAARAAPAQIPEGRTDAARGVGWGLICNMRLLWC